MIAYHPGTATHIVTKLYVHFVQDTPPANDTLIPNLATVFQQNQTAPNQIALVLEVLMGSAEFQASAGQKVKTPFEFLISAIRATGAEINPQPTLSYALSTMGSPLFHWPAPNGAPDVGAAWTGTNGMIRRWTLSDQLMAVSVGIILDGPSTLFAEVAPKVNVPTDAAIQLTESVLGSAATVSSFFALAAYSQSVEVLGAKGTIANPKALNAGLRRLAGAVAATPEFQIR